jgi:hypothetical protein
MRRDHESRRCRTALKGEAGLSSGCVAPAVTACSDHPRRRRWFDLRGRPEASPSALGCGCQWSPCTMRSLARAGSRWLALARAGSRWLALARAGSLAELAVSSRHLRAHTYLGAHLEVAASTAFQAEDVPPRRTQVRLATVVMPAQSLAVACDGRSRTRPRVDVVGIGGGGGAAAPHEHEWSFTSPVSSLHHLAARCELEATPGIAPLEQAWTPPGSRCAEHQNQDEDRAE